MVISTKSISGRTWHFSHAIGHHVAAVGFASPSAIAVGADDILYVSNCGISEGMGGAFANPLFQPRITKTTVEQEHICDSNTEEVLWPEGVAVAGGAGCCPQGPTELAWRVVSRPCRNYSLGYAHVAS